jgi:hypothetical protein
MPILFEKHRIAYFDTPKVASTSMKLVLHEIEHGNAMSDARDVEKAVHRAYPTSRISLPADFETCKGYWKLAIVRDPAKRLLSAYSNRILFRKDQYKGRLPRTRAFLLGLPLEPDVNTFFLRLWRYRLQSAPLRHHTDLVSHYLGTDLGRFDAIYPIEDLDRLAADLSARTGRPVTLPRLQTGGPKIGLDALSKPAFDALMAYLAPEYELLRDYYRPPSWPGPRA